VSWKELDEKEQFDQLIKNVRDLSLKAYKRVKSSVYEEKTDIVCQRENAFYIDTIRAFRDRRYKFKDGVKQANKEREAAERDGDVVRAAKAKDATACLAKG
jgi:DNA polymerase epsilon subunit 1